MSNAAIVVSIQGCPRTALAILERVLREIQLQRRVTGIASRHHDGCPRRARPGTLLAGLLFSSRPSFLQQDWGVSPRCAERVFEFVGLPFARRMELPHAPLKNKPLESPRNGQQPALSSKERRLADFRESFDAPESNKMAIPFSFH
jgi:hypothetical protein